MINHYGRRKSNDPMTSRAALPATAKGLVEGRSYRSTGAPEHRSTGAPERISHRHPDDRAEGRSSLSRDWYMAEVKQEGTMGMNELRTLITGRGRVESPRGPGDRLSFFHCPR